MNYKEIISFFDKHGEIYISKVKDKAGFKLEIRFLSTDREKLIEIRKFLETKYIKSYPNNRDKCLSLSIYEKNSVDLFINDIKDSTINFKEKIKYLIENYDFFLGYSNSSFDLNTFRGLR